MFKAGFEKVAARISPRGAKQRANLREMLRTSKLKKNGKPAVWVTGLGRSDPAKLVTSLSSYQRPASKRQIAKAQQSLTNKASLLAKKLKTLKGSL